MPAPDLTQFTSLNGFGSATDVPWLPARFGQTFRSIYVDTGPVGLHAVTGGSGPALLLVPGWPQNWYTWCSMMLPLSQHFTVIAVDPRGMGLSDKPCDGYDADTPAADLFALMDRLGFDDFYLAGHDVGMWIAFAMAAAEPGRVRKVALGEAIIPGVFETPPVICDEGQTNTFLWHNMFNRIDGVNERLVEGREEIYFGTQMDQKAGPPGAMPRYARDFYIEMLRRVPGALKGSFDYYRGIDQSISQYRRHAACGLHIPVFAFAGELACGDMVARELQKIAGDVRSVIYEGGGHYIPEQFPSELAEAFRAFFLT